MNTQNNTISYLERGRKLLRSVRNQRLWCIKHDKSYIETAWARKELNNIDAALGTIHSSAQMRRFLERKETTIRFLIPAPNHKRHEELRELLESNL